jgi:hypothetical protein
MKDTKHVSKELPEHVVDNFSVKILETSPIVEAHKEDRLGVMNHCNTAPGLSITSIKIEIGNHQFAKPINIQAPLLKTLQHFCASFGFSLLLLHLKIPKQCHYV